MLTTLVAMSIVFSVSSVSLAVEDERVPSAEPEAETATMAEADVETDTATGALRAKDSLEMTEVEKEAQSLEAQTVGPIAAPIRILDDIMIRQAEEDAERISQDINETRLLDDLIPSP